MNYYENDEIYAYGMMWEMWWCKECEDVKKMCVWRLSSMIWDWARLRVSDVAIHMKYIYTCEIWDWAAQRVSGMATVIKKNEYWNMCDECLELRPDTNLHKHALLHHNCIHVEHHVYIHIKCKLNVRKMMWIDWMMVI